MMPVYVSIALVAGFCLCASFMWLCFRAVTRFETRLECVEQVLDTHSNNIAALYSSRGSEPQYMDFASEPTPREVA